MYVGCSTGSFDFVEGEVGRSVRDVGGDGRVEEGWGLGDDGDVISEPASIGGAEEVLVETDFSGGGFVETLEKGGDGGFSGSRSSDDGDAFSWRDVEGDSCEDGDVGSRGVGKVDVVAGDLTGDGGSKISDLLFDDRTGESDEATEVDGCSFGFGDGGDYKRERGRERVRKGRKSGISKVETDLRKASIWDAKVMEKTTREKTRRAVA